jgi:hypothetical protein
MDKNYKSNNQQPPNEIVQTKIGKIDYYMEAVKLYYYNCILYNQFDKMLDERNMLL